MSERYSHCFSLCPNIGQPGSPVMISAGALLKDNSTGNVLVQLKLRNISDRVIHAVKIKVHTYDYAGCELKGIDSFSYFGLTVGRGEEFGSQTPIPLPDRTTCSFSVEILFATFSDKTVYCPEQSVIADTLDDATLKTVQMLDDERKEREAQKKKELHKLWFIAYLPLAVDVLAILMTSVPAIKLMERVGYWLVDLPYIYWSYWNTAPFVSLIVPCLCILGYRKAGRKPAFAKCAMGITGAFLMIQIILAVYATGMIECPPQYKPVLWFFEEHIDGCSLGVVSSVADAQWKASQYLFIVKNIIGMAALYRQAKNATGRKA